MTDTAISCLTKNASNRAVGLIVACFWLMGGQASNADSLSDRLSGNNIPDFTAVYTLERHNRLAGSTRKQIEADVKKAVADGNSTLIRMGRKPIKDTGSVVTRNTDSIMNEIAGYAYPEKTLLTISQHGNMLLVQREMPGRKVFTTFLYDGTQTMYANRGAETRIFKGFNYNFLREFVFPGCGLCGIQMCRNIKKPEPTEPGIYRCEVGLDDGISDSDNVLYDIGTIRVQKVYGVDQVTQTRSLPREIYAYRQECDYADYRRVCPDLSLPAKIHLREWYRPGSTLPYGEQYDASYKLVSATDKPLPDSRFTLEGHLPARSLVIHESKEKSTSVLYFPGSSVDSQFKADAENKRIAALNATIEIKRSGGGGTFGLAALILAICGWYIYRRGVALK